MQAWLAPTDGKAALARARETVSDWLARRHGPLPEGRDGEAAVRTSGETTLTSLSLRSPATWTVAARAGEALLEATLSAPPSGQCCLRVSWSGTAVAGVPGFVASVAARTGLAAPGPLAMPAVAVRHRDDVGIDLLAAAILSPRRRNPVLVAACEDGTGDGVLGPFGTMADLDALAARLAGAAPVHAVDNRGAARLRAALGEAGLLPSMRLFRPGFLGSDPSDNPSVVPTGGPGAVAERAVTAALASARGEDFAPGHGTVAGLVAMARRAR